MDILYEDRELLVARKPAGVATQTAQIGQQDAVSQLKSYLRRRAEGSDRAGEPYLGIVHRLDQPVEGLLVFAKTRQAAATLAKQLQKQGDGGFCKHYYAVLCGIPRQEEGSLMDCIYKESVAVGKRKEYRAVIVDLAKREKEHLKAQRAVLRYHILQREGARGMALADICLETGRFHQIRAQMAHAGLPLLGDLKYGDEASLAAAQSLGIRNVALCAYRLEFTHPASGKEMAFRVVPSNPAFSFFSQL